MSVGPGEVARCHLPGSDPPVNTSLVGQQLALVSPVAANRGSFTISVDGKPSQTIDTHSAAGVNRVIVWQTTSGKPLHTWTLPDEIHALAFAADGRHVAAAGTGGSVYVLRCQRP